MPGNGMSNAGYLEELVVLARHGQTALSAAGLLRGRLDAPLDQHRVGGWAVQAVDQKPPAQPGATS